ncbi:hypothetical protein DEJ15_14715 [Curtobacterium sp. MCJR17_043]|nr:hypothetical protein [Curtobacterium sp. MCJR17_043]WIB35468.1 hypothetical protein DEJ15_14715 [Curtobacterium sp. MCJR17_043]
MSTRGRVAVRRIPLVTTRKGLSPAGGDPLRAARQPDTEARERPPGDDEGDRGGHRSGLADDPAAEGRDGPEGEQRAERGQAAGEGDVEPPDRRTTAFDGCGDVHPDQERERGERVPESAECVGHRGERDAAEVEGTEEQDLEHDPDDDADGHHGAWADQVGERAGQVAADEGREARTGDDRRDRGRRAAEHGDHVRGDEVRLDADPGHHHQDAEEAEGDGAGGSRVGRGGRGRERCAGVGGVVVDMGSLDRSGI